MAYQELVKRFDTVRDYMRDFLIFGFRTRNGFSDRSRRTYDDERRRIESWLGDALRWEYRKDGKAVFLSLDAASLPENPLHRAWQSKSFTDRDIRLHFFLLALLSDRRPRHAEEIQEALFSVYAQSFDLSTIRRKLAEYAGLGLLSVSKEGRCKCFALSPCTRSSLFPDASHVPSLLQFARGAAPLSVVGHYLSPFPPCDCQLRFKHAFFSATLEDQILLTALAAIRGGQAVSFANVSGRSHKEAHLTAVPLKILWSVQNGRRYLLSRLLPARRFTTFRLDYIRTMEIRRELPLTDADRQIPTARLRPLWGTVIRREDHAEHFSMTIAVNEEKEPYIIQRLFRERRGGQVERVSPGRWSFSCEVYDTSELLGWVKSFTGRIVSLEGDNTAAIARFHDDIRRMAEMYRKPAARASSAEGER